MLDMLTHLNMLMAGFIFAAYFVGLLVFRGIRFLRVGYRLLLLGWTALYLTDAVMLLADREDTPLYRLARQATARGIIAWAHWTMILLFLAQAANGAKTKWQVLRYYFWQTPGDQPDEREQPGPRK